MRIRNALLAVAATVAAGSAIAAPAMAQEFYRPHAPRYAPVYAPVYGYGFGYHRPWIEGRPYWFHHDHYRYGYHRW
jgi:hypothetical protein